MSRSPTSMRLAQALNHFQERSRGEDLPDGAEEAVKSLLGILEGGTAPRDTPGGRAALKAAPGTNGTGEPMEKAVKGPDGISPGQRAARGAGAGKSEVAAAAAALLAQANAA